MAVLLLRADAGDRLGTGHVFRCLALAQAWQDHGGSAVIASRELAPALEERLVQENIGRERIEAPAGDERDADQTSDLAKRLGAKWLVLDGYDFGGAYQRRLKEAGHSLLAIDDYGHADHYSADIVLNQNLGASAKLYRHREAGTRLLLGPRYVLLRREFRGLGGNSRTIAERAAKVLVTLGGTDPDNVTRLVIEGIALLGRPDLQAIVLVGSANRHRRELEQAAAAAPCSIEVRPHVQDIASLMTWADVAVAAGGTTTYERMLLGLPSLVVVLADNQRAVAEACATSGACRNLGDHAQLTPAKIADALWKLVEDKTARSEMARRGSELVDGRGSDHVLGELGAGIPQLRLAALEDSVRVWEWANDPEVRRNSFSTEAIPWDSHQEWFAKKLSDPNCLFFIAIDLLGEHLGQVRCDMKDRCGTLSIGLDARHRSRGLASILIRWACSAGFDTGKMDEAHALIRPGNKASRRAFEKAGFVLAGPVEVMGQPGLRFILRKGD